VSDPLNLEYCLRLYPHDDNQGGFFVALLERVQDDVKTYDGDDELWDNSKLR